MYLPHVADAFIRQWISGSLQPSGYYESCYKHGCADLLGSLLAMLSGYPPRAGVAGPEGRSIYGTFCYKGRTKPKRSNDLPDEKGAESEFNLPELC